MLILYLILSVVLIILMTTRWNIHPFLTLIVAALFYGIFAGLSLDTILESINTGFGDTLGKIGLVIILGVIIGTFLEHSGAAYKLADLVLKAIGRERVHEAMGLVGFIVSIPVFADSGFIILSSLNKSLTKKAKLSIASTATVLMLGLMISHVLVPPTPGPIAAAGILGADIGLIMLFGIIVGLLTLVVAIVYAKKVAAKTYVDPNPHLTEVEIEQKIKNSPGAVKSFMPILIPIVLIINKSILEFQISSVSIEENLALQILTFIGTPVIALFIGMLVSFSLPRKMDEALYSDSGWIGKALRDSASILLITGAGGIFGTILQNSGIATEITKLMGDINMGIWFPFFLCAAIKTAQGSSTVALITTASIIAPMMASLGFETEIQKAFLVLAIGAGAAVVSHANDSGFWVMTQMSGLDVKTGYKTYTLGTLVVGFSAAFFIYILNLFF